MPGSVWRRPPRRCAGYFDAGLQPVADTADQPGNSGPNAVKQCRRRESDAEHEKNAGQRRQIPSARTHNQSAQEQQHPYAGQHHPNALPAFQVFSRAYRSIHQTVHHVLPQIMLRIRMCSGSSITTFTKYIIIYLYIARPGRFRETTSGLPLVTCFAINATRKPVFARLVSHINPARSSGHANYEADH